MSEDKKETCIKSKEIHVEDKKNLGKKTNKVYDLNDTELKLIKIDGDIVFKLMTNNKGIFVDIRKYYKGYPTKKGVRVYASIFDKVSKLLEPDIKNIVPAQDLDASELYKVISI
jgi:hypothetical protein